MGRSEPPHSDHRSLPRKGDKSDLPRIGVVGDDARVLAWAVVCTVAVDVSKPAVEHAIELSPLSLTLELILDALWTLGVGQAERVDETFCLPSLTELFERGVVLDLPDVTEHTLDKVGVLTHLSSC